jgi:hypothetical protein
MNPSSDESIELDERLLESDIAKEAAKFLLLGDSILLDLLGAKPHGSANLSKHYFLPLNDGLRVFS